MQRTKTVAKLHQAIERESNNMNDNNEMMNNPYGVPIVWQKSDEENLLCDLYARIKVVKVLNKTEIDAPIQHALPETSLFSGSAVFNTCAIVSSAGSLYKANLGQFIGKVIEFHSIRVLTGC